MKVVFLDIDGVLNNHGLIRANGFDYIDPGMVGRFGLLIAQTGASVVLSSSWRLDPRDKGLVESALALHGISLMGVTPSMSGPRSGEIRSWLQGRSDVDRFAILDDDDDAGMGLEESFFQTDPEVGLTVQVARAAADHLIGGRQ